jgi:hypothetical protein
MTISRSRYSNCCIGIWWLYSTATTGATEEYDGTSWATFSRKYEYSKTDAFAGAGTTNSSV